MKNRVITNYDEVTVNLEERSNKLETIDIWGRRIGSSGI